MAFKLDDFGKGLSNERRGEVGRCVGDPSRIAAELNEKINNLKAKYAQLGCGAARPSIDTGRFKENIREPPADRPNLQKADESRKFRRHNSQDNLYSRRQDESQQSKAVLRPSSKHNLPGANCPESIDVSRPDAHVSKPVRLSRQVVRS